MIGSHSSRISPSEQRWLWLLLLFWCATSCDLALAFTSSSIRPLTATVTPSQPRLRTPFQSNGPNHPLDFHPPTLLSLYHLGGDVTNPVGYVYMLLLAGQFAAQPLLTKAFTSTKMVKLTYVSMLDLLRLFLCASALLLSPDTAWKTGWSWTVALQTAGVPASLYVLQNYCCLVAYQKLSPLSYNVLNQTKTIWAAVFCYILMKKPQSPMQMVALLLLLAAAVAMQDPKTLKSTSVSKDDENGTTTTKMSDQATGLIAILTASLTSGLAGAWLQKSMQMGTHNNSLLISAELAALSLSFVMIGWLVKRITTRQFQSVSDRKEFWVGWTWKTWIPLVVNAFGGILVGLVTKYAGSVLKGFALVLGLFVSGLLQDAVLKERVTKRQWLGGVLAACSLWMHSAFPPTQ